MENTTRFDLNEAVRQWRKGLETSPALRPDNLDELQAHVRDSAVALQSGGLTPAEAFLIAARRLGHRADLEREFGKANARYVWLERCLWMVLGLLICRLSVAPRTVISDLMRAWELSTPLISILLPLVMGTVPLAGIAIVAWFSLRREQFVVRLARLSLRWGSLSGLAIVLLLYAAYPLAMRLSLFVISVYGPTPVLQPPSFDAKAAILGAWVQVFSGLQPLLWILLVPLLAGYAQRIRHPKSKLAASADVAAIAAGQRDLVERFQSQGLSLEEACFLAARREEIGPTVAIEAPNTRRILVERVLWMVVGVVLNMFIYSFLLEQSWIIAALTSRLTSHASVYGNVLGGLGLILQLGVAAAFVSALWRFVTRGHRANEWFASLFMKHPGLAALGLALIYLGIERALGLLVSILSPNTLHHLQAVASQWFDRQYVINQMVIPVVLLLWLARLRMKPRRA